MLPTRYIEAYLRFLLRYRTPVTIAMIVGTLFFVWFMATKLTVFTNFIDLYPPKHPYIQMYYKYRDLFGTSNVLLMAVEAKNGDVFSDPEIIAKVDRLTVDLLRNIPGVNGEQVISITHPKLKTTLTSGSGIKVVPLTYPRLPRDQEELEFLRKKVYSTEGVRGLFVSEDDSTTLITAGFWEEYFDLAGMWTAIQEIVEREEADGKVKIYVSGPPILYAYFNESVGTMGYVLVATTVAIMLLLWFYFRSFAGVVIPTLSGLMSAVWGLGFAGLCGFSVDPLVLVVFVLISARALSHSVQSMERYHEEYHRLGDKDKAIVSSYISLFSPAMVAIVSDSLAILTIAVASIPLMQKLAFICSFWIISIFLSVITLHPIVLTFLGPPKDDPRAGTRFSDRIYDGITGMLLSIARGSWRVAIVGIFAVLMAFGLYFAQQLKIGDTEIGRALLYDSHPYNVAFAKVNEKFVGASQLVIIAEGKKPEAIKNAETLNQLDRFQRHMEQGPGAGGSITATTLLKKIFRTFREGDPKWEMLPTEDDFVGQLFFLVTSGTRRGDMDRFFSPDYTNATISVFYQSHSNEVIHGALERAKDYIDTHSRSEDSVRYLLAGGMFGILAATNEEVEWSTRVAVPLLFATVFLLSLLTYRSFVGAVIVMIPSAIAHPLSEAVMHLFGIDYNINSLPVAAIGIGIGIDYGYYVLSRILEEYDEVGDFDEANRRAIQTTGKAVIFTGTTLAVSVMFWLFHPLKFEAQMALLLMLLLTFQLIGALVFIPGVVSLVRPKFAERRRARRLAAAA